MCPLTTCFLDNAQFRKPLRMIGSYPRLLPITYPWKHHSKGTMGSLICTLGTSNMSPTPGTRWMNLVPMQKRAPYKSDAEGGLSMRMINGIQNTTCEHPTPRGYRGFPVYQTVGRTTQMTNKSESFSGGIIRMSSMPSHSNILRRKIRQYFHCLARNVSHI